MPRRPSPPPMVQPPHSDPIPRTALPPYWVLRSINPLFRRRRRPSWWPLEVPVAMWAPFIAVAVAEHSPLLCRSSPGRGKTRHKAVRGDKGKGRVSACVPVFLSVGEQLTVVNSRFVANDGGWRQGQGNAGGSSRGAEHSPLLRRSSPGRGKTRNKAMRGDVGEVRGRVSAYVPVFFSVGE